MENIKELRVICKLWSLLVRGIVHFWFWEKIYNLSSRKFWFASHLYWKSIGKLRSLFIRDIQYFWFRRTMSILNIRSRRGNPWAVLKYNQCWQPRGKLRPLLISDMAHFKFWEKMNNLTSVTMKIRCLEEKTTFQVFHQDIRSSRKFLICFKSMLKSIGKLRSLSIRDIQCFWFRRKMSVLNIRSRRGNSWAVLM